MNDQVFQDQSARPFESRPRLETEVGDLAVGEDDADTIDLIAGRTMLHRPPPRGVDPDHPPDRGRRRSRSGSAPGDARAAASWAFERHRARRPGSTTTCSGTDRDDLPEMAAQVNDQAGPQRPSARVRTCRRAHEAGFWFSSAA